MALSSASTVRGVVATGMFLKIDKEAKRMERGDRCAVRQGGFLIFIN